MEAVSFFKTFLLRFEKDIADSRNRNNKNAKCFALKNYFKETFIKFVRLTLQKVSN